MIRYFSIYYKLVFFASISFLTAYPAGWSDDILLTPEDSIMRWDPDVTVDTFNNVWVVWDSATWVTAEILYTKRDSLGGLIIPETNISTNVSYSSYPFIAVDGSNNIQFIWRERSVQGMGIGHARLANDGSVIVPSHLALDGAGGFESSLRPGMNINKFNEINIIWDEQPSGYNQMNYTKLDSLGNPVIVKIKVSPDSFFAYWPGIGVDSMANIHLAYRVDDTVTIDHLLYTKLDRQGNILVNNKPLDRGVSPVIVADKSQNIHMVYRHPVPYVGWDIVYLKLDQNANILVGPEVLSSFEHNSGPYIAIDSLQFLHVVWCEEQGSGDIAYTKLDTNGNYVIPPMPIVYRPPALYPYEPRIAVDMSNRLHLVWMDQRLDSAETEDIYYKRGENVTAVQEKKALNGVAAFRLTVSPNPCEHSVMIRYEVLPVQWASRVETRISICNVTGQLVDVIVCKNLQGSISWRGTDKHGHLVPSGVYFVYLIYAGAHISQPLIIVR